MEYGLIGQTLGHSYSQLIHRQLGSYDYQLCPLPTPAQAEEFLEKRAFKGINVTIPYKQLVMPYCTMLDEKSKAIGAVNTVVNKNGLLYGYNTDYDGFAYLASRHNVNFEGRTVLILGTGGTSRTVHAVAAASGAAQILFASRSGGENTLTYAAAAACKQVQIIVNTSPVGMYPSAGGCLLEPADFPKLEAVLDAVYNPFKTELLLRAQRLGVTTANGLEMLVAQAAYAAQHFNGTVVQPQRIEAITRSIWADRVNICLIGMPSCGKTTIGKLLARSLNKRFVDLDTEIANAAGKSIPALFAEGGEEHFRNWESRITAKFGQESGQILSCGGGVVTRSENISALQQNGIVIFIDRPVEQLCCGGGRPLSTSPEALHRMAEQRLPLYKAAADLVIKNEGEPFSKAALAAQEAIHALFNTERP